MSHVSILKINVLYGHFEMRSLATFNILYCLTNFGICDKTCLAPDYPVWLRSLLLMKMIFSTGMQELIKIVITYALIHIILGWWKWNGLANPGIEQFYGFDSHSSWLTHWGRDKMAIICRWHFQMHFLEWKCKNSNWKFIEVCSWGSN